MTTYATSNLTVTLPKFEGPLALLLYLIHKEEMDIMDIRIHDITHQYLSYVRMMKDLDLEGAGDFIAMAATLIHIKSRMLLPQHGEVGEEAPEDPRRILVQRLIEYQKYQTAARTLDGLPLLGRDIWPRGFLEDQEAWGGRELFPSAQEEIQGSLFSLIGAYRWASRRMKKAVHQVAEKLQSIASRIWELRDRLNVGSRVSLNEILTSELKDLSSRSSPSSLKWEEDGRPTEGTLRRRILITFLSLLELGKMGKVFLSQMGVFQDIHIEVLESIDENFLGKVEEYEGQHQG